jgi:hypothetical protein
LYIVGHKYFDEVQMIEVRLLKIHQVTFLATAMTLY